MAQKCLLVGNWKMKLLAAKAAELARQLAEYSPSLKKSAIWVAPSATAIPATAAALKGSPVKLGAQNAYGALEGAFTGEVSVPMLKEFGCEFTILGHSERRIIFGESNDLVAQRAAAILKQGFTVIFCIGETLDQRKQGITSRILGEQLSPLFELITEAEKAQLIFAYEPVWAIGTGVVAKIEEIDETHKAVEAIWSKRMNSICPPILYGGSVAPNNFAEIIKIPLVAGGLIGGASLTFESMQALAKIAESQESVP